MRTGLYKRKFWRTEWDEWKLIKSKIRLNYGQCLIIKKLGKHKWTNTTSSIIKSDANAIQSKMAFGPV